MTVPAAPSTNPDFKESTPLIRAEPIYSGAMASQAPQTIPMATVIPIVEGSSHQTSKPTNENQSQFPSVAQTTTTTTTKRGIKLGRKPLKVVCPHCQHDGVSRTTKTVGGVAAVSAGVMFVICWPLFWIPLVCTDVSALLSRHAYNLMTAYCSN
jgi:lipopolysaccharide-induced tumor necrosis factor-alpha factor